MITLETLIDITDEIERLKDRERIEWMEALVASIQDKGTITKVREIINSPSYDD